MAINVKKGIEMIPLAEYQQLQTRVKEQEKQFKKLHGDKLTEEKFLKELNTGMAGLPSVKVTPHPIKPVKPDHEEDQILLFSDLHAGEVIEKAEVDGFNEYNFEIMCNRLWQLMKSVINIKDLHSHAFKIKRLWVLSLGDLVTGEIHNQDITNERGGMIQTIQQTAMVISQMLMLFASRYEEIQYVGIAGNHDRRFEKPRTKQAYDNWGTMLNWMVQILCSKQKNIKFHVPKSPFLIVNIRGHNCLLHHGTSKAASYAGIPFYGISKKHSAYQELYRERGGFSYEFLGHYHQSVQLKDDRVFISGSCIGANEFAINELAAYSPPSQKLLGISEKRGVTYSYKLTLQDADHHGFVYNPEQINETQSMTSDFISTQFNSKRRR